LEGAGKEINLPRAAGEKGRGIQKSQCSSELIATIEDTGKEGLTKTSNPGEGFQKGTSPWGIFDIWKRNYAVSLKAGTKKVISMAIMESGPEEEESEPLPTRRAGRREGRGGKGRTIRGTRRTVKGQSSAAIWKGVKKTSEKYYFQLLVIHRLGIKKTTEMSGTGK